MAVEWCKSMSTEATLGKLVTTGVMAEATIGGWMTSDDESYPEPHPGEILCLRISTDMDLGIRVIPFFANCVIIIGLPSATSIQIMFYRC
jgi:hypothetical protein